ncbi:MAG: hypothetical protein J1E62_08105 [Lachnospiraceae bacterium]|nr:hypothetical protein [Lachnospiraceae bacterium]
MQIIRDHKKLCAMFHLVNLMGLHSVLDFGGSLARGNMFSRRYWKNSDNHIDISQTVRLDSFDIFDACKFPVYQQLYHNIYHELDEVMANFYDMATFIDIIPFMETDVFLSLCDLFRSRCSLLVLQLPPETNFPLEELHQLGHCVPTRIVGYDYMVIWTNRD